MTVHLNRCFYHDGFTEEINNNNTDIEANDKMLGDRQISLHNQQRFKATECNTNNLTN